MCTFLYIHILYFDLKSLKTDPDFKRSGTRGSGQGRGREWREDGRFGQVRSARS